MDTDKTPADAAAIDPGEAIRHFEVMLDVVEDVVWAATADSTAASQQMLFISPSCELVYGRSPQEFIDDPQIWITAIHPDDRVWVLESLSELFENDRQQLEYRIVRPDGEVRWLQDRKYVVRDPNGRATRIGGIATDVTLQKQLASTLLQRDRDYARLLNTVSGMAYRCRNDENWTMELVSEGCLGLTGYPVKDLLNNSRIAFADLVHRDDADPLWAKCQASLAARTPCDNEYRIVAADGTEKWVRDQAEGIYSDTGELLAIEGLVTDITTNKRARELLEAKNQEMERFTYTVSHDLKSPLVTIRGFAGLLMEDPLLADDEERRDSLGHICRATDTMAMLLDQLLDLSKLGLVNSTSDEVSVGDLASEVQDLLSDRIASRNVRVVIENDMPAVVGDRVRLLQLVQNLIDNAVKFAGDRTAPVVEVGVRRLADHHVFFVRDNGPGIEPCYHDQVFDLFERLDARSEGTGIGLALAKRIVESHNGSIWVESEGDNSGCAFCFRLGQPGQR